MSDTLYSNPSSYIVASMNTLTGQMKTFFSAVSYNYLGSSKIVYTADSGSTLDKQLYQTNLNICSELASSDDANGH